MDKDKKILFIISMFLFVALFSLSTFLVSYNSKKLMGNVLQENENNEIKYIEKEHDLTFEFSVANYFTANDSSEVVDVEDGYAVLYNSLRKLVKYDFKGNLVWHVSLPYLQEEKLIKDNIQHFTNSSDKNSFVIFGSMTTKAYDKESGLEYDLNSSYIYEIKVNEQSINSSTKEVLISSDDILFSQIIFNKIFQTSNTSLVKNVDDIILSTRDSTYLEFYKYNLNTKEFSQVIFGNTVSRILIRMYNDLCKKWFNPVLDSKGNIIFVADQIKTTDSKGILQSKFRVIKIDVSNGSSKSYEYSYNKNKSYTSSNLINDFNKAQYIVQDFYLDNEDNLVALLSTDENSGFNDSLKSKIIKITPGEKDVKAEMVINENSNIYNNIFKTEDNCFIMAGYYYTDIERKNYSFMFSKYNNDGKLLWSKIDKEEETIKGKISSTFLSKNERVIFVGSYSDQEKFFITYANDYEIIIKMEDEIEEEIIIPSQNTGKVDSVIDLTFNTSSNNEVVDIKFIDAYNNKEVDIDYNMEDNMFVMPSYDIIIEPIIIEKTASTTSKEEIVSTTTNASNTSSSSKVTSSIVKTSKTTKLTSDKITTTNRPTISSNITTKNITISSNTSKTTIISDTTTTNDEKEVITSSTSKTKLNKTSKTKNNLNIVIYILVAVFGIIITTTIIIYNNKKVYKG